MMTFQPSLVHKVNRPNHTTIHYSIKTNIPLEALDKIYVKCKGLKTDRGKGDSCRGVKAQSEEVSLQAVAQNGMLGNCSYEDGEVISPLGS